jgi:hypothetical protein
MERRHPAESVRSRGSTLVGHTLCGKSFSEVQLFAGTVLKLHTRTGPAVASPAQTPMLVDVELLGMQRRIALNDDRATGHLLQLI